MILSIHREQGHFFSYFAEQNSIMEQKYLLQDSGLYYDFSRENFLNMKRVKKSEISHIHWVENM